MQNRGFEVEERAVKRALPVPDCVVFGGGDGVGVVDAKRVAEEGARHLG